MDARQLSLPKIDMRPICPACKRPANVLAQWSPWRRVFVCRECCEVLPYDPAWLDESGDWHSDTTAETREAYMRRINVLTDATRKRRYYVPGGVHNIPTATQLTLPACRRCGTPVAMRLSTYPDLCHRCEAEDRVDALWRMRNLWRQRYGDVEDMLDGFYQVFPELFELGVMPDRWFELAIIEDREFLAA